MIKTMKTRFIFRTVNGLLVMLRKHQVVTNSYFSGYQLNCVWSRYFSLPICPYDITYLYEVSKTDFREQKLKVQVK